MNIFRYFFRYLRWRPWMRIPFYIIGFICLLIAIWIGLPMTGVDVLASIWFRATVTGVIFGIIFLVMFFKWRARRRKAREIEDALVPIEPVGDGKVLAERMQSALATLKKSGGAAYLYDLPWYVIIGPPGAGKTTALQNSGIEFPLSQKDDAGVVSGFGGTRYCDWWFAEDAVMIDTAGRYTTQDSDKTADENSWNAFLELLKKARPSQPINGIILAFSVEDMMTGTPESLAAHAETVRARLAEIHEALRVDFPVYVLFTKADLISGFREYFSSFNLNRRRNVWGVTFQTKDRKKQTHEDVPAEFDLLVSRLSDEIIDRLSEEPDSISRVAIFGLPGQMALLRDNAADFLRRVFEPTRYKSNAILRGFYFTSGTQEGTPIDQVLGEMSRNEGAAGAFAPAFMSGQGKSFFIHDLLKRVIFAERDWVSHDVRAVRRAAIWRGLGLGFIGLTTVGLLAALGVSFWLNRNLVNTAGAEAAAYARAAQIEINRTEVEEWDLTPILPYLERVRTMPAGYAEVAAQEVDSQTDGVESQSVLSTAGIWEGFGLGQRHRLRAANTKAYSDALEQMLRPRLVLDVERQLQDIRLNGEPAEIYRALKVYMLLGGQGEGDDKPAIKAWFADVWRVQYTGLDGLDKREQLERHLDAMLTLDNTRDISITINEAAVVAARSAIVQMSVADQAYALITDAAKAAGLPQLNLVENTGPTSGLVFTTTNGEDLATIGVDGLYTFDGYWFFFVEQLDVVREKLEADKWVLGDQADGTEFDAQLAGLDQALHAQYGRNFVANWEAMFAAIQLTNMSADKPRFDALAAASAGPASPIYRLAKMVERETKLTRMLETLQDFDPAAFAAGGGAADDVASSLWKRVLSRSGGLQRIILDAVSNQAKDQTSVNGTNDSLENRLRQIESNFEDWYAILAGQPNNTAIDLILQKLVEVRDNLRIAQENPAQSNAMMPQLLSDLTRQNSRLPGKVREFVNDAESDFRSEASNATMDEMNRAYNNDVLFTCRENIIPFFPFSDTENEVALAQFGRFFGPDGNIDRFYTNYLARHVIRTGDGLVADPSSPLADRLLPNTLLQFDRALKIRDAFFAGGGTTPQVNLTFEHVASSSDVQDALLAIGQKAIVTTTDTPPMPVSWPTDSGAIQLLLSVPGRRSPEMTVNGGVWSIVRFLDRGRAESSAGNKTRRLYVIGGLSITYDIGFDAVTNPFTMSELANFDCPQALD